MGGDEHLGASVDGGVITGLPDIRQGINRENRLNSTFSDIVHATSEFRPLGVNCRREDFLSAGIIAAGVRRLQDLPGDGHQKGKVAVKALFREHLSDSMESPGEQPMLFVSCDENSSGLALAWFAECEPDSTNTKSLAQLLEHGSVWFAQAALIIADGSLLSCNERSQALLA